MKARELDQLEAAYTMDLLARLTESIETYLEDDRWDGIDVMHAEIKEANKLVKKYYARIRLQHKKMAAECVAEYIDQYGV